MNPSGGIQLFSTTKSSAMGDAFESLKGAERHTNSVREVAIFSVFFSRGDRGWLSHGLVVTLPISYSLDVGTLCGFTRDMRIAD